MPVASFTVTKLRWLAEHEPAQRGPDGGGLPAARLADLAAGRVPPASTALVTDRGDASGTGYWSPRPGTYRPTCWSAPSGTTPVLPRVLGPAERGRADAGGGAVLGPGRRATTPPPRSGSTPSPGDVVVSIGTSGTVFAVSATPERRRRRARSPASPTPPGNFLPLVATLNAARVLDATARLLGVDHDELSGWR